MWTTTNAQMMSEQVRINATELEENTFNLFLQQLDSDVHVFKCYVARVGNVAVITFRKKRQWLAQARQMSEATTKYWWEKNVTLLSADQPALTAR